MPARVLTLLGAGSVVAGGLVTAVTGALRLGDGSWLAAYLVLVSVPVGLVLAHLRTPS